MGKSEEELKSLLVKVKSLSRIRLFATPWTVAYQAPPSMGSSRPEYWSGLPFPSPGDLPDPGIKLTSLASLALEGTFFTSITGEALNSDFTDLCQQSDVSAL